MFARSIIGLKASAELNRAASEIRRSCSWLAWSKAFIVRAAPARSLVLVDSPLCSDAESAARRRERTA